VLLIKSLPTSWKPVLLQRSLIGATTQLAIAVTMVVAATMANIGHADATPTCPGPMTADGLACCVPGSTPTSDDSCQLPGGGLAASCALSQLTTTGMCCPLSATPQPDGTCQPSNGYAAAPGCPLGQLDKGGLSCCPAGQTPQADGSCQASAAQQQPTTPTGFSPCPPGLTPYARDSRVGYTDCTGAPIACLPVR